MDGCIYRTKDGECELWENDRNHFPFCNPACDHKHPSNADRIRAMTDAELAEWIYQVQDGDAYQKENFLPPLSKAWWLDWLKQEAGNGPKT